MTEERKREREQRRADRERAAKLGLTLKVYRRWEAESEAMSRESVEKVERLLEEGNLAPITILNYCK